MNPSRSRRAATSRHRAHQGASDRPARRTVASRRPAHRRARPVARIAAVAESAPTTRWRDDPKMAKSDDRQQDRVQAGDDRHAGDLGVAHDLGDRQRRQGRAGDDIGADPGRLDRQDPAEQEGRGLPAGFRGCRWHGDPSSHPMGTTGRFPSSPGQTWPAGPRVSGRALIVPLRPRPRHPPLRAQRDGPLAGQGRSACRYATAQWRSFAVSPTPPDCNGLGVPCPPW